MRERNGQRARSRGFTCKVGQKTRAETEITTSGKRWGEIPPNTTIDQYIPQRSGHAPAIAPGKPVNKARRRQEPRRPLLQHMLCAGLRVKRQRAAVAQRGAANGEGGGGFIVNVSRSQSRQQRPSRQQIYLRQQIPRTGGRRGACAEAGAGARWRRTEMPASAAPHSAWASWSAAVRQARAPVSSLDGTQVCNVRYVCGAQREFCVPGRKQLGASPKITPRRDTICSSGASPCKRSSSSCAQVAAARSKYLVRRARVSGELDSGQGPL